MAKYTVDGIDLLKSKILAKSSQVDKTLADSVNVTSTYARRLSVERITARVALQPGYVNQRLKIVARASANNPRSIIRGKTRATLLTRYPYVVTSTGVKVKVNQAEGFKDIRRAFLVRGLRGSLATGIAMRNAVAYEYYKKQKHNTKGKLNKLNDLKAKAKARPKGLHIEHSRSINQLFDSVRVEIQPSILSHLSSEFLKRLNK